MIILGIGGILGDAAAAVLKDGELVAAVEQRKLGRRVRPDRRRPDGLSCCSRCWGCFLAASNSSMEPLAEAG